ncbi:hypothetical protein JYU34_022859 [Plutella xylostella]|uniref:Uncharacterized protein n=1 Tax=Plutella xylostella TaxID=51655 RepID=A0ABQ7PSZ1_PLUXY|nr:hypothetical protein JYU34_022859 [Plutella xylostella]
MKSTICLLVLVAFAAVQAYPKPRTITKSMSTHSNKDVSRDETVASNSDGTTSSSVAEVDNEAVSNANTFAYADNNGNSITSSSVNDAQTYTDSTSNSQFFSQPEQYHERESQR